MYGLAIADSQPRENDGGCGQNSDHRIGRSAIDNCCRRPGADHIQADADGEILGVRRRSDHDGIARSRQHEEKFMKEKVTISTMLLLALFLTLPSTILASTRWYVNGVTGSDTNNCLSSATVCGYRLLDES